MLLGMRFREAIRAISPQLEEELDQVYATMSQTFTREHDEEGRHTNIRPDSVTNLYHNPQNLLPSASRGGGILRENSGHQWLLGPWIFDELGNDSHHAVLRPPQWTANQNNYAPAGIDTAFGMEIESDAARDLTGISVGGHRQKRLMWLINVGNYDITIKHNSSSSIAANRFGLVGSADVTLSSGAMAWVYYSVGSEVWRILTSTASSGGVTPLPVTPGTPVSALPAGVYEIRGSLSNGQVLAGGSYSILDIAGPLWPISGIWIHEDSTSGGWVTTRTATLKISAGSSDLTSPVNICQGGASLERWRLGGVTGGAIYTTSPFAGSTLDLVLSGGNTGGHVDNFVSFSVLIFVSSNGGF